MWAAETLLKFQSEFQLEFKLEFELELELKFQLDLVEIPNCNSMWLPRTRLSGIAQAWSTVPCIVAQPVKNKVVATRIIIDLVIEKLSNKT